MSSPIVNQNRNKYKNATISIHQKLSHSHRTKILSTRIAELIKEYFPKPDSNVSCLDIGTGDMTVAEQISEIDKRITWKCIDIHDLPENLKNVERWNKYQKFDGANIPFADKFFDVAIFSDVLHHTLDNSNKLISEAVRVSKIVIIKDHFEYSFYSRFMLKMMDFIGNWGYGISIPQKYFTEYTFYNLIENIDSKILKIEKNIDLYNHLPIIKLFLKSKWQFIASIKNK